MDKDKIFDALRNCITEPKCKDCPWETCEKFDIPRVRIPVDLGLAILALLKEHEKEQERVMRIIRETIHQAMYEPEKGKDFEDFVCELIEHRIYHTNR